MKMKLSIAILAVLALTRTLEVGSVPLKKNQPTILSGRDLKDDLNDLLKLVPADKIEDLFYQYLAEDEDFREALDYVMSDDFKSLFNEILAMPEVKELLEFLKESGLDPYGFIEKIKELLGFNDLISNVYSSRIRGGLPGFLQDVNDLLPVKEIEKLYNKKLETSKDFAALITRLKSKEFQGLIDKAMANEKLQDLMKRAEAKGVDVQAILDFFTTLLGIKFPPRPEMFSLKDDLNDLLKLVPSDKIEDLFYQYLAEDEDFREALDYVMSDDFKSLFNEILAMPEVKKLLKFLEESGLDPYGFIEKIKELLGFNDVISNVYSSRIRGGLPGFLQDVNDLLPVKEIEKLYNEKLETSKDFAALITRLKSKEFQGLIDKAMANEKLQDLMKRAEAKGVDVQAILDFFTTLLGIKFPPRPEMFSLKDDLNDLLKLVLTDKIEDLFYQYLAEDEDFREALDYVMSDDFKSLFNEILAMPEVKELLKFLEESGLDPNGFIQKIKELLGFDEISLRVFSGRIRGGLPGFLQDVTDLLPVKEIEKLYNKKLETSKDFAALRTRLKSKEFQGLIDKAMANEKLQDLMKRAEAKGVDVQAILDFFTTLLGIKFPPRPEMFSLKDDLNDLLKLVPTDKIEDLFYQYLAEDEDFREALDYVMSDDFKSLFNEILAMPEVKELLKFLEDSGLDPNGFIQKIKELLGFDEVSLRVFSGRIRGGLPGFLQDVTDLLPVKEIEKLYNKKLETSKDFAALITRLKSKEFQGLIDKAMANEKLQDLMKRAEAKGVDVQAILDFFTTLLGIKFPPRPEMFSLKDDLNDLLKLVPTDKIEDLFYQYLAEDEDFREALDYVMSDDFKSLFNEILAMPEVKELLKFLEESGLDPHGFIKKIKELLGFDEVAIIEFSGRIRGGLPGFLQDITDLLPVKEIEKLYNKKLETSKDFAALITRLKSKEFQGLINKAMANEKLQDLMKRAEAKGVDVQAILDFFTTLLGIKFPPRPKPISLLSLKDDLDDFMKLVPKDQIQDLVFEYLGEDEDFRQALDYFMSDDFKSLATEIGSMSEVIDLVNFLEESGLDVRSFIEKVKKALGFDHIELSFHSGRISGGLSGFIKDVLDLLPLNEIEKLYKEKLEQSPDFSKLIKRLGSNEFQELVYRLSENPKMLDLISRAKAKGVDIHAILDFLSKLLGLKFPSAPPSSSIFGLKEDFDEFINLIPIEKVKDLFYEYLDEDEDFRAALDYLTSDDFEELATDVGSMTEVIILVNYIQNSGVDIKGFIASIKHALGFNRLYSINNMRITGGLSGFLKDIIDLLPMKEIEKLYNEKLKNSKDFAELIRRLKAPEFQRLVDRVAAHPQMKDLIKKAKAKGVDVKAILDFLTSLLGLKFPSTPLDALPVSLREDIDEFLELVPRDKIEDLFYDYLAEDEDFGEALDYLMSDDFKALATEIGSMPEVIDLVNYLQESGLDAYGFIEKVKRALGFDSAANVFLSKYGRVTGGLSGFIHDVIDLLPVDKIGKLYNDKLKNSKEFSALVQRLQSPDFQNLVDRVMANPKMQDLLLRAEAKGVNVQEILDFITSLLGLKFPKRPVVISVKSFSEQEEEVIDILRHMWSQVPTDKVSELLIDYLVEDTDFQKVVKYMLDEEFKEYLVDIEELQEIKDLLKFLNETGVDSYGFLNKLHDLVGLVRKLPFSARSDKISGGLDGLMNDVMDILPLPELYKYYDEKMENSPKFKEWTDRINTRELQNAVTALGKNKGWNKWLDELEKMNLDVNQLAELVGAITGIKFPIRPF